MAYPSKKLADRDTEGNQNYAFYIPGTGVSIGQGPNKSFIYCFGCGSFIVRSRRYQWPEVFTCCCGYETKTTPEAEAA